MTDQTTCSGCLEDQANQLAHMGEGGCLELKDDTVDDAASVETNVNNCVVAEFISFKIDGEMITFDLKKDLRNQIENNIKDIEIVSNSLYKLLYTITLQ